MKKKIVFIITSFRRGGVERVTLNILNSLNTDLYDVTLIICCEDDHVLLENLQPNVAVVELKKKRAKQALLSIFKLLKSISPDIVFTSFIQLSLAILTYKVLFRTKFKTIVRMNTLPSNKLEFSFTGKLSAKLFSKIIYKADHIISQTDEMKSDIVNFYKCDESKVITIRNLVDFNSIKILSKCEIKDNIKVEDVYTLISIGSLGEVKGFDLLIKAISNLINTGNKIKLYIIGDNRESNEDYGGFLEDLILKYRLENFVTLLGFKKNPYPYLKQADAFVLSSRKEGFPNVVLEALVLNKPCLVTNCIDFSDIIIENVNGVVVEKESVEALEEGVLKVQTVNDIKNININNFDYNKWFKSI